MARRNRARYLAGASFIALSLSMGSEAGAALHQDRSAGQPGGLKSHAKQTSQKSARQQLPDVAAFGDLLTVADGTPAAAGLVAQSVDTLRVENLTPTGNRHGRLWRSRSATWARAIF